MSRWGDYARARGLIEHASPAANAILFHGAFDGIDVVIEIDHAKIRVCAERKATGRSVYARRRETGLARSQIEATGIPFIDTYDELFDERYEVAADFPPNHPPSLEYYFGARTRTALLALNALWFENARGKVEIITPNLEVTGELDYAIDIVTGSIHWKPSELGEPSPD